MRVNDIDVFRRPRVLDVSSKQVCCGSGYPWVLLADFFNNSRYKIILTQ